MHEVGRGAKNIVYVCQPAPPKPEGLMRRLATVVLLLVAVCLPVRAAAQGSSDTRGGAGVFEVRTLEVTGLFLAEAWDFNGRPGAALAGVNVAIGLPIHGGWAAVVE